jgi:predicted dehydrogenase
MIRENIWLIGTGYMAIEYAKVLNSLNCNYLVVGRGESNAAKFKEATGKEAIVGGLEAFLNTNPALPTTVINAVGIEYLTASTMLLLKYGVRYLLLEKPGFAYPFELEETNQLAKSKNAEVVMAFNRRFYQSTLQAQKIIEDDGGVTSFNFEFTEWAHVISKLDCHEDVKRNWFYGNSTHLIDLAFFLGGDPDQITCYSAGGLRWHPNASVYAGAGLTKTGALFSYVANWESPGRWNLELTTKKHRLIFKPVEKLQIMKIGSVAVEFDESVDYKIDEDYKPGLYLQTEAFLLRNLDRFISLSKMYENMELFYNKINPQK